MPNDALRQRLADNEQRKCDFPMFRGAVTGRLVTCGVCQHCMEADRIRNRPLSQEPPRRKPMKPDERSLEAMDQRAWEARSVFSGAVERMVTVSNAAEVADRLVAEAVRAVSPPEEATEAERERIYSLLRALASDGDCGCDQYCTCGQSGGCCHWYHMDPEARRPGPTQDLLRAIVNGTDQQ